MTLRLHIDIGNEAMCEPQHVAAALERVARVIERGGDLDVGGMPITDPNGNTVGRVEVVE